MIAKIVVGLGFGDEGKGITVDYLCRTLPNPIVVRFSGGQQAGHTVKIGKQQHTHKSFGSGTLRGVPSYFSEHTTIDPIAMMLEYDDLVSKGVTPVLYIHPLAKVTTPYDVRANLCCNITKDHGTCGKGIGKTMERNEGPCKFYAIDLTIRDMMLNRLASVASHYNIGVPDEGPVHDSLLLFDKAVLRMKGWIRHYHTLKNYENIIFEGSQGILLDMDHGHFPFVTYASTTSKNAMDICDKLDIDNRAIYGVTRAYHTRHGNSTFKPDEIRLRNIENENNVFNNNQGEFFTSKLKYDYLNYAINIESIYSGKYPMNLVVTCNDQIVSAEDQFDSSKLDYLPQNLIMCYGQDSEYMVLRNEVEV